MRFSLQAVLCCSVLVAGCAHAGQDSLAPAGNSGAAAQGASAAAERPAPRFVSPYAYAWFIRAELERARGHLAPALDAYRNALSEADDEPYVLARYASALDEHGERAQADHALSHAFEFDACSEPAWLARAQIAEHHAEIESALLAYERAESCAPASAAPPLGLAALLRSQHDDERALAVLERFEARTLPGSRGAARARLQLALARRDATGVASAASTLAQQSTSARAELLQAASALLDQNEPQLAAHVLKAIAPAEGETRLRLRVLLECGKLDAAENLLATSTPSELGGLTATAEIYLALDRPASALELAQTALAQRPDDASARVIVGFAQLALGHATEAATLFAGIPAASRSHEEAVLGLSQALRSQGLDALAREVARSGAERDQ